MHEIAVELGTDWHTINDAVIAYGEALLEADVDRIPTVRALSLDEACSNEKDHGGSSMVDPAD